MNYFSTDYFTARSKFIIATNLHYGRLKSYRIDAEIPLADELTIDVAIFGNPDASKAVVRRSVWFGCPTSNNRSIFRQTAITSRYQDRHDSSAQSSWLCLLPEMERG
jgi:Protein of unknown function (DUF2817)